MAAKPKEYRRLPGRGVRRSGIAVAGRTRLWLGKDHLLAVDAQWFAEDYKRFYFRDIQAVIIRKTIWGKVGNLVLAGLAFLPLLAALSLALGSGNNPGFAIFWGFIACFMLGLLVGNTLMGPTCACYFKTAVQVEDIPSLRRLRRARKVLRRIRPFIVEAQGELTPEELAARTGHVSLPPSGRTAAAPPFAGEAPAAPTETPGS